MAEKDEARFNWRNLSLLAYGLPTAVGYLYATGYYGNFRIDILNYVEPLDLLLISLDNVNNIIWFFAFYCLFVLPATILVLLVAALLGLAATFTSLAIHLSLVLACVSGALAVMAGGVAAYREIADRMDWAAKALRATFSRQGQSGEGAQKKAQQRADGPTAQLSRQLRPLAIVRQFVASYEAARDGALQSVDAAKGDSHVAHAEAVIREVPALWKIFWKWNLKIVGLISSRLLDLWQDFFEPNSRRRLKKLGSLPWPQRLVVLGALTYIGSTAYLNGKYDAQEIRVLATNDEPSSTTKGSDSTSAVPDRAQDDDQQVAPDALRMPHAAHGTTVAVPEGESTSRRAASDGANEREGTDGDSEVTEENNEAQPAAAWNVFCSMVPLMDCDGEDPLPVTVWRTICPLVPLTNCGATHGSGRPVQIFAIPTANVASLVLERCREEGVGELQYARAILRQDVGDAASRAMSDCLVYLGATGSMQFLADFQDVVGARSEGASGDQEDEPVVIVIDNGGGHLTQSAEVHPVAIVFDARDGAVSAHECNLKLVTIVGPFRTGLAVIDDKGEDIESCPVPGRAETAELVDIGALRDLDTSAFGTLVLVGRADVRPINNEQFDSNMDLVQRRVEAVAEPLRVQGSLSILSIPGGPMDSSEDGNACSRIVEIYGCHIGSPPTSTDAGDATSIDGAAPGEDLPSLSPVSDS